MRCPFRKPGCISPKGVPAVAEARVHTDDVLGIIGRHRW